MYEEKTIRAAKPMETATSDQTLCKDNDELFGNKAEHSKDDHGLVSTGRKFG
jgi:hypothetical protein